MWGWFRSKSGRLDRIERVLTQLLKEVHTMAGKIADLQPILESIQADVAPIGAGIDSVLATLAQLQANAGNPSNATTLSPEDQTALDNAITQGQTLKAAFDGIQAKLPPAPPAS